MTQESLIQRLSPLLPDQDVTGLVEAFDTQGFCVIPELLDAAQLARQREAPVSYTHLTLPTTYHV